jgi:hypothetical protein
MSALSDRVYRQWLLANGAEPTERERWLRDALLLRPPGGLRGVERSVTRGRSAPAKRSPN